MHLRTFSCTLLMHAAARRAEVWRRTQERARRCACFFFSSNGFVMHKGGSQETTESEAPIDGGAYDNASHPSLRKPPLQSLHKAILAGEITLAPFQKVRKNGNVVTIFSVATGGMWRLPMASKGTASEDECTDPCLQYHKVIIHNAALGKLAVQTLRKGMQVYVEGELETRVFNDAETGNVKCNREIAVHETGKILPWIAK